MNQLYKRTLDHVTMPQERVKSIRASLASRCSNNEMEVIPMKKNYVRRSASLLIAAILLAIMSVSALAYGIYYYVTYEINENSEMPDNAVNLTDQNADFEIESYDYHEEDGMIIVDFDGIAANEDVSYEISENQTLTEFDETVDLTKQDAEFEVSTYRYTEEDGKITVDLSDIDLG